MIDFHTVVGLTFSRIEGLYPESESVRFYTTCGRTFIMYHEQDCCESVYLESVSMLGNPEDFINTPIIHAEEASNPGSDTDGYESSTWTFYKLSTQKGSMTLRWFGSSNGYYSESVTFKELV